MDKDLIFDFLKKNAFALSCGVVAVGAVVSAFYPFGGLIEELQQKSTTEAGNYQTISSLMHARKLPNVDPDKATPGELTLFPTKPEVDLGKAAVAELGRRGQPVARGAGRHQRQDRPPAPGRRRPAGPPERHAQVPVRQRPTSRS